MRSFWFLSVMVVVSAGCGDGKVIEDTPRCPVGMIDCDRSSRTVCEVNPNIDPFNCGGCGVQCAAGQVCRGGVCQNDGCGDGLADCDGVETTVCETSVDRDPNHCGGCGNTCSVPNAQVTCVGGVCGVAGCLSGFTSCDGLADNGCEADLRNDPANCSNCGVTCSLPNAVAGCAGGICNVASCEGDFRDCDGDPSNGCESNTMFAAAHCGGCNQPCASPTPDCLSGVCGVDMCPDGQGDCDGDTTNGCEVDTNTDINNCGGCGMACDSTNGTPSCVAGECQIECNEGFDDCDGPANGCEVNTNTDATNCGGCGNGCEVDNAAEAACTDGQCTVGSCEDNFSDCDGIGANGCEVNTRTDAENCGGCGSSCDFPHATGSCSAATCSMGDCEEGWADCDMQPATGCEVNLNEDLEDCGECDNACPDMMGMASCSGGTCGIACDVGFADCDAAMAGCETSTDADVSNCGGCNILCSAFNGTPACAGGDCSITCDAGFADCDVMVDGCETNIGGDITRCGACDAQPCVTANGTPFCAMGACGIASCDAGFDNCDGEITTGCETNLQTTVERCGTCGTNCNVGAPGNTVPMCTAGACEYPCAAERADCDGDTSNGCEVNTQVNDDHCNGCNMPCGLGRSCMGGTCI